MFETKAWHRLELFQNNSVFSHIFCGVNNFLEGLWNCTTSLVYSENSPVYQILGAIYSDVGGTKIARQSTPTTPRRPSTWSPNHENLWVSALGGLLGLTNGTFQFPCHGFSLQHWTFHLMDVFTYTPPPLKLTGKAPENGRDPKGKDCLPSTNL